MGERASDILASSAIRADAVQSLTAVRTPSNASMIPWPNC